MECLENVDRVVITENVESVEAATGFETTCKFSVTNANEDVIFTVTEATNCCLRQICGAERPFGMSFTDETESQIMYIERPYRGCCFTCGFQHLDVESPPGTFLGQVTQDFSLRPYFSVADSTKQPLLSIRGPYFNCRFRDIKFEIYGSESNEPIGTIEKHDSATGRESVSANFPQGLDVKKKALLISSCFLVGAMYFNQ